MIGISALRNAWRKITLLPAPALGTRRADVVLGQRIHHRRAHVSAEPATVTADECQHRQNDLFQLVVADLADYVSPLESFVGRRQCMSTVTKIRISTAPSTNAGIA